MSKIDLPKLSSIRLDDHALQGDLDNKSEGHPNSLLMKSNTRRE